VAEQLPQAWDKQLIEMTFEVIQLQSHNDEHSVTMAVRVLAANAPAIVAKATVAKATWAPEVPATVQAANYSLRGKTLRLAWYRPEVALAAGQQWQAQVMVRRPRGLVNPEGFDYAAWVLGQGYQATGYIKAQSSPVLLADQPSLRDRLRAHLRQGLSPAGSAQPFFEALLLGQREGITPAQWQILQATGTVHLMAISGLHVGLVAALGFALGLGMVKLLLHWHLWRRGGVLPKWMPQSVLKGTPQGTALARGGHRYRWLPVLLAIVSAASYAALAGMAVPTQRALWAVVLLNVAWWFGLKSARWQVFAWVLLLVVISEPMAALQSGFWLSFAAVAILMVMLGGLRRSTITRKYLRTRKMLSLQCVLAVAMALPLWLLGLPASVLSPLANLVAVPVVALLMVPALLLWVLLSFTPLSALFIQALAYLFKALWWGLEVLAQWPYAAAWGDGGNASVLILAALALMMLLLPRTLAMRAAGCSLMVLVLWGTQPVAQPFKIVILDVGQGLAVVVHDHQHTLLYDTGPAFSPRFNAGANIVVPYLRQHGLPMAAPSTWFGVQAPALNPDLSLMVSHADKDHSGGFVAIADAFAPANIWVGEPFEGLPTRTKACERGQHWRWQNADYQVLWPPAMAPSSHQKTTASASHQKQPWSGNNSSCVVLIKSQGVRFLLAGDIEAEAERQLLAEGDLPEVDVLIAPHHGSKTSSSLAFLAVLKPKHVIVSAGYKSAYGHPHASVVARYTSVNAQVWNTAEHGAVTLQLRNGALNVVGLREQQPKFWY
jgi:competence protein ComEC